MFQWISHRFRGVPQPANGKWWLVLASLILAGLGCVWLADWGARGPTFARGMAQQQASALGISLVGAWLLLSVRKALGLALVRWAALWSELPLPRRWRWVLVGGGFFLGAIALLHWGHKLHQLPGLPSGAVGFARFLSMGLRELGWQPVTPSITSELLRWPACLLMAWLLYRAAHARLSGKTQAAWSLAVMFALLLGLWISRDKGPILVMAVAWVCVCAAALRLWLLHQSVSGGRAALGATGVLLLGLSGVFALLPQVAPAERVAAWQERFAAPLEYLAEITWFLQAAGWQGFGLEQTPWCGYLGTVVGSCQGMPVATQSDLTLAALAGLWGAPLAWGVAAAVAAVLVGLIRLAGQPRPATGGVDALGWLASVGAFYALLMLAQWSVTVLGNVGLIPLTGVSLPYFSWGRTGLMSLALATALVWPGASSTAASGRLSEWWKHLAWVGAVLGIAVQIALALGFVHIYKTPAPEQASSGRVNPWQALAACVEASQGQPLIGAGGPCEAGQRVASLPGDTTLRAALGQLARQQPLAEPWVKEALIIPRRATLRLSLDAALQTQADELAACLTGSAHELSGVCDKLPDALKYAFAERHESAAARSLSMVTLRLRDGALLAIAHARSPCSVQQMAGEKPAAGCPTPAARQLPRPGRQSHQALRAHDMIGSTIKPLLAASLLASDSRWATGAGQQTLHSALVRSDTAFFIDRLLCWDASPRVACLGLAQLQHDIEHWRLGDPIALWKVPKKAPSSAPTLTLPGLRFSVPAWPPHGDTRLAEREQRAARACSQRPADQRWRGCGGEHLAATLAPLWGQGEARSHPLAVAALYLRLAAAARGERLAPAPHLWRDHGAQPVPAGFDPTHARLILNALRDVPLLGTAASACRSVRGPAGCVGQGWAMKTGTSLFPHDGMTAEQRAAHCAAVHAQGGPRRDEVACALYPMKWAVLMEDNGQPEARLTVVLAERNWSRATGRIDAADDLGPNVAAQAAVLLHALP